MQAREELQAKIALKLCDTQLILRDGGADHDNDDQKKTGLNSLLSEIHDVGKHYISEIRMRTNEDRSDDDDEEEEEEKDMGGGGDKLEKRLTQVKQKIEVDDILLFEKLLPISLYNISSFYIYL